MYRTNHHIYVGSNFEYFIYTYHERSITIFLFELHTELSFLLKIPHTCHDLSFMIGCAFEFLKFVMISIKVYSQIFPMVVVFP